MLFMEYLNLKCLKFWLPDSNVPRNRRMADDPFETFFPDDDQPTWLNPSHNDSLSSGLGDPFARDANPFDPPPFPEFAADIPPFPDSFTTTFTVPFAAPPPAPGPPPRSPGRHQRFPTSPPVISQLGRPRTPATFLPPAASQDLLRKFQHMVHARQRSLPVSATLPLADINAEFTQICADRAIKFNPHRLGFIPTTFWPDQDCTFGELVAHFFQKKNNSNSRFSHKLFNALKIAEEDPFYVTFLGVEWVTEFILKVDKKVFARLLGIKTIDGSLFHQQGNFPSHGFIELSERAAHESLAEADFDGVDYENVRLLTHQPGIFIPGCTEEAIERCKWISSRKRV
jgi:hypothetical protein